MAYKYRNYGHNHRFFRNVENLLVQGANDILMRKAFTQCMTLDGKKYLATFVDFRKDFPEGLRDHGSIYTADWHKRLESEYPSQDAVSVTRTDHVSRVVYFEPITRLNVVFRPLYQMYDRVRLRLCSGRK